MQHKISGSRRAGRIAVVATLAAASLPCFTRADIVWDGTTNAYRSNHWGGSSPSVGISLDLNSGIASLNPATTGQFITLSNASSDGETLNVGGSGTFSVGQVGPAGSGYGLVVDQAGELDMDGRGTVVTAGPISVGQDSGNSNASAYFYGGTVSIGFNLSGSNIIAASGTDATLYVGNAGTAAVYEQSFDSSASVTTTSVMVGAASTGNGTYQMSSGTLSTVNETIGNSGNGFFNQQGGTNTISTGLFIAHTAGSTGDLILSAGNINVSSGSAYVGGSASGAGGTGILNVSGGMLSVANTLSLLSTSSTVNLLGTGTIQAGAIAISAGQFNVGGGTLSTASLNISSGGVLNLEANANSGILVRSLSQISLSGSSPPGQMNILPASNHSNRQLAVISALSLAGTAGTWQGKVDLANNDLDLQTASLATITSEIKQGYNSGNWNGSAGIVSTSAANDTTHLTALGVIQNNQSGSALFTASHQYDGTTPGVGDILVKFTYYGDANLDGKVDGSDYTLIDNGYLNHLTGWYNGDFNYDNVINGSDYALIDNAFNRQGAQLTAAITAAQISSTSPIPEPAMLGPAIVAAAACVRRHRRQLRTSCVFFH